MPASLSKRDILQLDAVEAVSTFDSGPARIATPKGHTIEELQDLLSVAFSSPAEPKWPLIYPVAITLGLGLLIWSAAIFGISRIVL